MRKVLILAYDFPPYVSVGGLRQCLNHKVIRKPWLNVPCF